MTPTPAGMVIAGTASGVGKTTVAVGIMAALRRRGLRVQSFKIGPDFIDGGYHGRATGRPPRNLDGWLMPEETLRALYARRAAEADCSVIEGVMGLFDGYDGELGSTAHVAKLLGLPVVLVMDAKGAGASVAAAAYGFERYDPDLAITGVIANRIGSPQHAEMVTAALRRRGRAVPLGCLPRDEALTLPHRHLGLVMAEEAFTEAFMAGLADLIERHLDLDALVRLAAAAADPRRIPLTQLPLPSGDRDGVRAPAAVRLAVARDPAFCFYYEDNLDLLREAGAEVCFFSPLSDADLPDGIHGLYIGGGYPELHAAALAANRPLRAAIRRACIAGLPVYAECGGLMYLTEAILTPDGLAHEMVGLFQTQARMLPQRKALGYVEVKVREDCLVASKGARLRGHEYHYSELTKDPLAAAGCRPVYDASRRRVQDAWREGYMTFNTLASYVHLHFASRPETAADLVRFMKQTNGRRRSN